MLQISSMFRVLDVFFTFPTKRLTLKDISVKAGIAHTSVKKQLDVLVKKGLVLREIEKKGTRIFPLYKANRESTKFIQHKRLNNIESLFNSGLLNFLEENFMPKSIILFGSFLRGEDTEESDVDLFVEAPGQKLKFTRFEKRLGRRVELHFNESFHSYPTELKNNLVNGLVVHGFLEGYRDH